MFGAGEAGCYPNIARAFAIWLPQHERVRAQGIIWMISRWGGAFTPLLVAFLFQYMDWRMAFVVFGSLGVSGLFAFALWFRDNPRDKPECEPGGTGSAEGQCAARAARLSVAGFAWLEDSAAALRAVLRHQLHLVLSDHVGADVHRRALSPGRDEEHVAEGAAAFHGRRRLHYLRRADEAAGAMDRKLKRARKISACTGFAGASAFLILATMLHDPYLVVPAIAMSSFCNDLVMPAAWGAVMDISGSYSGTVAGSMNMIGNLGGALYGTAAGWVCRRPNRNWDYVLYMGAAVYLIGFVIWTQIDPVTPITWTPRIQPEPQSIDRDSEV